jgi:hypothetical protein
LVARWPGTSPTPGYDLAGLRADLDRLTFLLGGDNGEQLFLDEHVEHPRTSGAASRSIRGHPAASASQAATWFNHVSTCSGSGGVRDQA